MESLDILKCNYCSSSQTISFRNYFLFITTLLNVCNNKINLDFPLVLFLSFTSNIFAYRQGHMCAGRSTSASLELHFPMSFPNWIVAERNVSRHIYILGKQKVANRYLTSSNLDTFELHLFYWICWWFQYVWYQFSPQKQIFWNFQSNFTSSNDFFTSWRSTNKCGGW